MSIKISGTDAIDNNRKGLFQSANVGTFNPGNRPGSAATGDLIYNTSTAQMEVWNGSSWVRACGASLTEYSATGGNAIVTYNGHKIHIFTSPGTFSISPGATVEYVVVAGGGAGGPFRGGGGAGGLIYNIATLGGSYSVSVGAGGAPGSTNGSNSSIPTLGVTVTGGGRGAPSGPDRAGSPGGSGGGGGFAGPLGGPGGTGNTPPTSPIQGYPGNPGAPQHGGSGGGASESGDAPNAGPGVATPEPESPSKRGGAGMSFSWGLPPSYGEPDPKGNPVVKWFGGGGTGYGAKDAPAPLHRGGGLGGGGDAMASPFDGLANTGGGGGGGGPVSGSGGSGIVMFRYRIYQ